MKESDVKGGHLSQEQLEAFVPRLRTKDDGPPREHRRHLEACDRCRRELRGLESLDRALASLPDLDPPPRFTEAVMARVDLPVPWYRRAWAALLDRWLLVALVVAGAGASTGGVAWWVATRPELTVGGLSSFVLERISALFWTAVVAAGQLLWTSGLAESIRTVADTVDPVEGLAAMAVLAACAATAGVTMLRLMDVSPPRLGAAGNGGA